MATPPTLPDGRSPGYETRDVNIRGILWLAIATAGGAALVHLGLYFLVESYAAQFRQSDPQKSPLAAQRDRPPGPRLQDTPLADFEDYQSQQERLTDSYGWVDRKQGVVRIPVEQAMELYLQRRAPPTEPPTEPPTGPPTEPPATEMKDPQS